MSVIFLLNDEGDLETAARLSRDGDFAAVRTSSLRAAGCMGGGDYTLFRLAAGCRSLSGLQGEALSTDACLTYDRESGVQFSEVTVMLIFWITVSRRPCQ